MARKQLRAYETTVCGACGVGVFYEFEYNSDRWSGDPIENLRTRGGCGWTVAGFIKGDRLCDRMYKALSKRWKILYESPVKLNINSGNEFYFVVFEAPDNEVRGFYGKTEAQYREETASLSTIESEA